MPINLLLSLSLFLLVIGLTIVWTKKQTIFILLGIELMTHGAHLHIMTWRFLTPQPLEGHILVLFTLVILIVELAVALALLLQLYQTYRINTFPHSEKKATAIKTDNL